MNSVLHPNRRKGKRIDKERRSWIQHLACVACLAIEYPETWREVAFTEYPCMMSEAHHAGERGLGQRAAEDTQLPLCWSRHHSRWSKESVHVVKDFWERLGLNLDQTIREYQAAFEAR